MKLIVWLRKVKHTHLSAFSIPFLIVGDFFYEVQKKPDVNPFIVHSGHLESTGHPKLGQNSK
jgi:hypothetical protein